MLELHTTAKYRKDYKRLQRRGLDMSLLDNVIKILREEKPLPPYCRDHALSGNFADFRECHIAPDWLLIYAIDNHELVLTAAGTGTHSDLFKL